MILHTLNASPAQPAFADCVAVMQPGDAVVLMGDGVYAALGGTAALEKLQSKGAELYLLGTDALVAGVTAAARTVNVIDMDGLVALTERFPRQQAWY